MKELIKFVNFFVAFYPINHHHHWWYFVPRKYHYYYYLSNVIREPVQLNTRIVILYVGVWIHSVHAWISIVTIHGKTSMNGFRSKNSLQNAYTEIWTDFILASFLKNFLVTWQSDVMDFSNHTINQRTNHKTFAFSNKKNKVEKSILNFKLHSIQLVSIVSTHHDTFDHQYLTSTFHTTLKTEFQEFKGRIKTLTWVKSLIFTHKNSFINLNT